MGMASSLPRAHRQHCAQQDTLVQARTRKSLCSAGEVKQNIPGIKWPQQYRK